MPTRLFSLYIRGMALYEKNPENSKLEKFLLWIFKTVGVGGIGAGVYGFYVFIPIVMLEWVKLDWSILNIITSLNVIIFGIGLLVYYKKTLDMFSRLWIFVPMQINFATGFLRNFIYYEPTMRRIISEGASITIILILISCWFYARKKYPEEFGLKS